VAGEKTLNPSAHEPLPALATGDTAAFSELIEPHRARLVAIARRIVGCPDRAQDAVQEAFVALWQESEPPRHARPWLFRAVLHRSLHARRTAERRRKWEDRAAEEWVESCPMCGPDQRIEAREERMRLVAALAGLCPEQQEVLELRALEGLSYQEIATRLRLPLGTVRSRLSRAREALQARLVAERDAEPRGLERHLPADGCARRVGAPARHGSAQRRPREEDTMQRKVVRAARFGGRLLEDRRGAALAEYGLLVAGIALVAMAAVSVLGNKVTSMVGVVAAMLPGADPNANAPVSAGRIIETTVNEDGAITIDGNANSDVHGGAPGESRLGRALGLTEHQMGHLVQDPNTPTPAIGNGN
jgi:RNA polymerase sigma-70 factor (ECF subfamily)